MPKWEERFDHIDDVLDTEQARGAVESAAEFPRPELSASPPRVPAGTIIQAPKRTAIECPECIEAEPDIETHHAAIRADERKRVLEEAADEIMRSDAYACGSQCCRIDMLTRQYLARRIRALAARGESPTRPDWHCSVHHVSPVPGCRQCWTHLRSANRSES